MTLSWSNYRSLPDAARQYQKCTLRCRSAFEHQRRNISKVIAATRPSMVAVCGVGVLNDVMYAHLLDLQAEVHPHRLAPGSTGGRPGVFVDLCIAGQVSMFPKILP